MNKYRPIPLFVGRYYKLTQARSIFPAGTILRYEGYSVSKFLDGMVFHLFMVVEGDSRKEILRFSRTVVTECIQELHLPKTKEA